MRRRVVCDASALVALLLDSGADGQWVASQLDGADLLGPTLLPFEVANIIRRLELTSHVAPDQAAQAHAELLDLAIELWPYEVLAAQAWRRRSNLTVYDASYVAVAELLGSTLVTLDRKLAHAPGLRCEVLTP